MNLQQNQTENQIKQKIQDDPNRNQKGQGDYFGVCPECGYNDGYLNVGRHQFMVCNEHKVCWIIGTNLFSSWRYDWGNSGIETYQEFEKRGLKKLESYRLIANGEEDQHPAQIEYYRKLKASKFAKLKRLDSEIPY